MNAGDDAPLGELREGLVQLAAFLLSAARGLQDEPPEYATYRLADGGRRALELVDLAGPPVAELSAVHDAIDDVMSGSMTGMAGVDWPKELDGWCHAIATTFASEAP